MGKDSIFSLCYQQLEDDRALVVRGPNVRIVGTVTNLSRPYQEILIVSSVACSHPARQDGMGISQQTRRPPRGQQPCQNPWAAERAASTVMGYCTTLSPAPDVFMHLGLRACCAPFLLVGGRCPAPRSARLASDAYVTHAIPAREATKPQELHAPQNRIRRYRLATFSAGRDLLTKSPRKHCGVHTIDPLSSLTSPLGKTKKDKDQGKKVFGILPLHRYLTSQGQSLTPL
ncbi:hypothetical protein J3F84DRAFT_231883 [Trichoderma pleuroticola]